MKGFKEIIFLVLVIGFLSGNTKASYSTATSVSKVTEIVNKVTDAEGNEIDYYETLYEYDYYGDAESDPTNSSSSSSYVEVDEQSALSENEYSNYKFYEKNSPQEIDVSKKSVSEIKKMIKDRKCTIKKKSTATIKKNTGSNNKDGNTKTKKN